MKGKGSRPDLQVAISGWENKVLGTESGKNFCGTWTRRKVFCAWFGSVQSLSHVRLFETPWTAAHQASLSITNF